MSRAFDGACRETILSRRVMRSLGNERAAEPIAPVANETAAS